MKIALCTTTIHVPHALKLMRKCSPDVVFVVAFDKKTPVVDMASLSCEIGGDGKLWYSTVGLQEVWKCSDAIGWNTLARRNIAFLEALKWGADVIYSWDNDNLPVDLAHFDRIEMALGGTFDGIKVTGNAGWFDPGQLLVPPTRHRGYPHNKPRSQRAHPVTAARIGVAAGLVIGDPDIDAVTRIELKPDIGAVHLLGQTGVVVDPHTWTVFNSQNTAVIRELIPAWFMMPGVGRHDDIYASLIVQRVARERGLHTHFGPPFTYQQRNEHNLITDLRAEIDGMENVEKLVGLLDGLPLPGESVIGDVRMIYEDLRSCGFIPARAIDAAMAWLEDCESVL